MEKRTMRTCLQFKIFCNIKQSSWFCIVMAACLLLGSAPVGAVTEKNLPDSFSDVIDRFSSLPDRSTGTAGNVAAATYLKEKFETLGYKDVGAYRFSVPVIQHAGSQLTLPDRKRSIELYPISGNAVTPQTIAAPASTRGTRPPSAHRSPGPSRRPGWPDRSSV